VRQLVLSPRWILWHLLTLGAMITCGWLAVWQWQRAGSALGSAINIGYGLQWPIFAVFFGVMWWRFLRMEIRELAEDAAPASDPAPASDAAPASDPAPAAAPTGESREAPVETSPFTRGPRRAAPVTDEDDSELAAYNRMLAILAERDRAQS
jgi:hypothetical protein